MKYGNMAHTMLIIDITLVSCCTYLHTRFYAAFLLALPPQQNTAQQNTHTLDSR